MHMPVGNVIVSPPFSGMHGQSLIDMSIPYVNQGQMVSSVTGGNPQGGPNQSMGETYSQIQMSEGGTAFLGGNTIPQHQIPHGNPHYNTIPQGNYYTTYPMYNIGTQTMRRPQGSSSHMSSPWSKQGAPKTLAFLATLDIPDLYKLTNDPIYHNLLQPPILHKMTIDTPKFDRKQGEDPGIHNTTYHLCCVSNSMVDDSVQLHLFPSPSLATQLSVTLSYHARQ